MARYRILEIIKHPYFENNHYFQIQKRVLGFLWWTDFPFEFDGYVFNTGTFNTLKEASECLEAYMSKPKIEVIITR